MLELLPDYALAALHLGNLKLFFPELVKPTLDLVPVFASPYIRGLGAEAYDWLELHKVISSLELTGKVLIRT